MKISESLISKNQNFINYWTAESSYNDLKEFANKYILTIDDKSGTSFDHSSIFQREYNSEITIYQKNGIISGSSPEIKEFNSIMEFLYLGRKAQYKLN